MADRIIVIDHGRVIAEARPEEIKGGKLIYRYFPACSVQHVNVENGTWRLLTLEAQGKLARLFAMGVQLERLEVLMTSILARTSLHRTVRMR